MPVAPILAVLLVVDSLHFIFARALEPYLPPTLSAFFVIFVATVEVALFAIIRKEIDLAILRRHIRFFLAIGFLIAISTALTYASVFFIDPGTAAMLAQTFTVFALAFGLFWLREHLTRLEWIGAGFCMLGAFLISFQADSVLRFGSVLVLIATFCYALHAAIVKRYGGGIDFLNFFLFRLAFVCAFLFLFALGQGHLQAPPRIAWPIILVAGTVDVVVSRILYYVALRRIRLGLHAIILTLSPVLTILFSWFLFKQLPTQQAVIGGVIVIGGIMVVALGRQSKFRPRSTAG